MKREENKFDTRVRDAAMQYGVDPPASAWDRIAGGLDARARSIRLAWYRRVAVAASILLAFFIGYYFPSKNSPIVPTTERGRPFSRAVSENTISRAELDGRQASLAAQTASISNASIVSQRSFQPRTAFGNIIEQQEALRNSKPLKAIRSLRAELDERTTKSRYNSLRDLTSNAMLALVHPMSATGSDSKPVRQRIEWSVGGEASPMYAYREIADFPSESGFAAKSAAVDLNADEKPLLSYSTGLTASATFGKRWSLQSGVQYSRQGQSTTDFRVSTRYGSGARTYTSAGLVVFNQKGDELIEKEMVYFDGQPIDGSNLIQKFDYLELPLVGKFKFIDRRLDMSVFAGVSTGLLVGNSVLIDNGDGTKTHVGYTYGANKSIFNSLAGIGINMPLTKRFDLSLSPGIRYALTPINDFSAIESRPYSFTLSTSVNFNFRTQ